MAALRVKKPPEDGRGGRDELGPLEDIVRLNVNIPRSLRRRFKQECAAREVEMSDVVLRLVRGWLDGTVRIPDDERGGKET